MGTARSVLAGFVLLGVAACDSPPPDTGSANASAPAALTTAGPEGNPGTSPALSADIMRKWSRSCVLCHVDGNGGAPRLGNATEWQPRLAQGKDVLLQHTLVGLNNMPPLGYCMSCERDDFVALIDFMSGGN